MALTKGKAEGQEVISNPGPGNKEGCIQKGKFTQVGCVCVCFVCVCALLIYKATPKDL